MERSNLNEGNIEAIIVPLNGQLMTYILHNFNQKDYRISDKTVLLKLSYTAVEYFPLSINVINIAIQCCRSLEVLEGIYHQ